MKPTIKAPVIEALLKRRFGFDRREYITKDVCVPPPVGCGQPIKEFKTATNEREYTISGLCQDCQDRIFGE